MDAILPELLKEQLRDGSKEKRHVDLLCLFIVDVESLENETEECQRIPFRCRRTERVDDDVEEAAIQQEGVDDFEEHLRSGHELLLMSSNDLNADGMEGIDGKDAREGLADLPLV